MRKHTHKHKISKIKGHGMNGNILINKILTPSHVAEQKFTEVVTGLT